MRRASFSSTSPKIVHDKRASPFSSPTLRGTSLSQPPLYSKILSICIRHSKSLIAVTCTLLFILAFATRHSDPTTQLRQQQPLFTSSTQDSALSSNGLVEKSCPNPAAYKPQFTKADVPRDYASQCSPLPMKTEFRDTFEAYICPTSASLPCNSFSIILKRISNLDACSKQPFSKWPEVRQQLASSFGPDAFSIVISGTEAFSISKAIYDPLIPCQYTYPVTLSNGGSFNIQIFELYQDWNHLSEIPFENAPSAHVEDEESFPLLIDQHLLFGGKEGWPSSKLPKFATCAPQKCKTWAFNPTNKIGSPSGSVRTLSNDEGALDVRLPLCSQKGPIAGAYFPDETPVQNLAMPKLLYRWHPLGCRMSERNLRLLDGVHGLETRKECLAKPRNIVFQGDSHTRMTYDALVPRLMGDGISAPIYYKAKNKTNQIYETTFKFVWDSHFVRLMDDTSASQADILVLSVGAHQCRNRWGLRVFEKFLQGVIKYIKGWKNPPVILQLSLPAKLPIPSEFRTHARVELWNEITLTQIQESNIQGIRMIDGFGSTLPFARKSPDKIHFRDTPAQEAWLMMLVHQLDLCEEM